MPPHSVKCGIASMSAVTRATKTPASPWSAPRSRAHGCVRTPGPGGESARSPTPRGGLRGARRRSHDRDQAGRRRAQAVERTPAGSRPESRGRRSAGSRTGVMRFAADDASESTTVKPRPLRSSGSHAGREGGPATDPRMSLRGPRSCSWDHDGAHAVLPSAAAAPSARMIPHHRRVGRPPSSCA